MNKRNVLLFFSCLFLCFSCAHNKSDKKIITVTIDPQRYFLEQIVDTIFEVHTMVPSGISPETYDPSPMQMTKLSDSEAYFRIGQIGFELTWMDRIRANNPNLPVFDNSDGINYIVSEKDEHNGHIHSVVDPHIWNSPKRAFVIAQNMCDALIKLNKGNEEIYRKNLTRLNCKIAETDSILTGLLNKSASKSFIIYHPALTYFAHDYGLTQYCIEIDGKEPTPEQLKQLIELSKEKKVKIIFIQQEFDKKNAEIIAKETNSKLIVINPLAYDWDKEMIRIAESLSDE